MNADFFKIGWKRKKKNNSSLGQEWECPGVGKTEAQLFMPQEELLFPRSDSCQPRSEGCPAEAGGRGWTFRPRLAVRPRKWKCLLRHEKLGWRFSMSRTKLKIGPRILFFWGRGLDLRLGLNLSLRSELQHCKSSLKVSRSSTENSRP